MTVRVNPAGARYSRFPGRRPRLAAARRRPPRRRLDRLPRRRAVRRAPGDPQPLSRRPGARCGHASRSCAARARAPPARGPAGLPAPPGAPRRPGREGGVLTGGAAFLDGTPVAGATVQIQLRSVSKGDGRGRADRRAGADGRPRSLLAPIAVSPASRRGTCAARAVSRRPRRCRRRSRTPLQLLRRGVLQPSARCRAHAASSSRLPLVSPSSGSVCTSSVGAGRARAHRGRPR